ncbi:hypothetical protein CSOJ01_02933 [Colletotrichum sojae]|uniref:Uncharacterized protein n=1 Tax=Colletotrichum sojae TaxID=2175907 RepID=A0A8H6JPV9_9PEZI|nr:hypothetical protein CSOJ01_02933 [Colletotrichum sojae]
MADIKRFLDDGGGADVRLVHWARHVRVGCGSLHLKLSPWEEVPAVAAVSLPRRRADIPLPAFGPPPDSSHAAPGAESLDQVRHRLVSRAHQAKELFEGVPSNQTTALVLRLGRSMSQSRWLHRVVRCPQSVELEGREFFGDSMPSIPRSSPFVNVAGSHSLPPSLKSPQPISDWEYRRITAPASAVLSRDEQQNSISSGTGMWEVGRGREATAAEDHKEPSVQAPYLGHDKMGGVSDGGGGRAPPAVRAHVPQLSDVLIVEDPTTRGVADGDADTTLQRQKRQTVVSHQRPAAGGTVAGVESGKEEW